MCIIVDANIAWKLFPKDGARIDDDAIPVMDWLLRPTGNIGALVSGGQLTDELNKVNAAARVLLALKRAGKFIEYAKADLDTEEKNIPHTCQSNDRHILALALALALARVSGARLLYSEDQPLHQDFKNTKLVPAPRGVIYQSRAHQKLLKHSKSCPKGRA